MSFLSSNKAGWIALNLMVACGAGTVSAADQTAAPAVVGATEAEIARARLQKEEGVRQAQLHVAQGRQLMTARRYQEALEQFALARNLDPTNPDAVAGRTEALKYLEARPSSGSNASQMVREEAVRHQLGLAEVNQQLALARKAFADASAPLDNMPDKAKIQQIAVSKKLLIDANEAVIRAKLRLDSVGATIKPEERDRLLNDTVQLQIAIRNLQAGLQQQMEQISGAVALSDAQKEKQVVTQIESSQRQTILKAIHESMRLKQYDEALSAIHQLLEINPADQEARNLKDECNKLSLEYRDKTVQHIMDENRQVVMEGMDRAAIASVSPRNPVRFPDEWATMVRQKEVSKKNDMVGAAVLKTRRKMEDTFSFEFVETEFNLILDTIRNTTGMNIVVDKSVQGTPVMSEQLTFSFRNMRLDNIFAWVMRRTSLRYEIDNTGIVNILTKESEGKNTSFEVIDIRDIAFAVTNAKKMPEDDDDDDDDKDDAAADTVTLGEVLKKFISTNAAAGGKEPEIEVTDDGQLMMNASEEIRQQVIKLLAQLRSAQTIQVSVSARFLTLQDNFWEQFRSEFMDWNTYANSASSDQKYLQTSSTPNMVSSTAPVTPNYGNTGGYSSTQAQTANPNFNPGNYWSEATGSFYYGTYNGLSSVFGDTRSAGKYNNAGLLAQVQELGFLGDLQAQWLIQMIRQTDRADELFCPQLVVYNNRYGWIKFVNKYPYISAYGEGDGDTGLVPTISYIDEGCSLQVRPNISADRKYITVDVRPRVTKILSTRADRDGFWVALNSGPYIQSYQIELPKVFRHDSKTYAIIPDGGAIMITGLSTNVNSSARNGVPFLQDMPGIGNAFSSRFNQKDKRNYSCLVSARMILLDEEEARHVDGK